MKIREVYGRYVESVEKHPVMWGLGAAAVTAASIGLYEGFNALQEALAPNGPVVNLDPGVVTGS